jgi:stalled ribosome rescue protein Dom34
MSFHFLIIIFKTYLKKRNERETENEKEKAWKEGERKNIYIKIKIKKCEFGLKMVDLNSKPTSRLPIM